MSTLQDTDLFVVDRNGTNYKLPHNQMSTLQDTDLLVVERNGTNYKIEAVDLDLGPTGSIDTPVAVLTPLNGAGTNAGTPYEPLSTAITAVGGAGQLVYSTDTIASVVTGGTLTSISCFQDASSGSSAVAAIYVDGVILTNSSVGSVTSGVFTNDGQTNTYAAQMFDGNTSTSCFSLNQGFATFTFSPPITFNTLEVRGWTSNSFSPVYVNGEAVPGMLQQSNGGLSTVAVGNTTLTFPTDNNFDKFEVGDKAQEGSTVVTSLSESDYNTIFGGTAANPSYNSQSGGFTVDFANTGFTGNTTMYANLGGVGGTFNVYASDLTTVLYTNSIPNVQSGTTNLGVNFEDIGRIEWTGDYSMSWFKAGGVYVNPPLGVENFSITAIDAAGPTITTDGGSWLGADGTGDAGDGRYEPSQEWSSSTGITDSSGTRSSAYIFDGVITGSHTNGLNTHNSTITLANSVTATSSIRFYGAFENATGVRYTVNGTTTDAQPPEFSGNTTFGWASVTNVSLPVTINNVGLTDSSTTNGGRFVGIEIDGKLLVDSSVPGGAGSTDISKTVTSDATLTFTDDTELANMVGPLEQVDANGNVKTPVTSEIASVVSNVITVVTTLHQWNPGWTGTVGGTYAQRALQTSGSSLIENGGVKFTPGFPLKAGEVLSTYGATEGGSNGYLRVYFEDGTNDFMSGPLPNTNWNSTGAYQQISLAASGQDRVVIGVEPQNNPFSNGGNYNTGLESLRIDGQFIATTTFGEGETLTFSTPNPDLPFFSPGDDVGTQSGFAAVAYTGDGSTSRSISSLTFSPDLVWFKNLGTANYHQLHDIVRGPLERIFSNSSDAESTYTTALTSFDSNGWTMNNGSPCNGSGYNYIAWAFDAGNTTVTNNDGTIATQVRSNGNFSIINWDGNGSAGTVGTGLSSVDFIISKCASQATDWAVWSSSYSNPTGYLALNLNSALSLQPTVISGAPTGGVVPLGSNGNYNTNMIMYAWSETPGVSSFGEYTGSSSSTSVDCGFEPAFVMVKKLTGVADWIVFGDGLGTNTYLKPSTNDAQATNGAFQILSNGFKLTNSGGDWNASGQTYIYAAFAANNPIEVLDVDLAANTMIVDGGDWHGANAWNQSQEWSSITGITDPDGTRSSAHIFNGVITGNQGSAGMRPYNATVTLANSVVANSSIRFYGAFENPTNVRYTVNSTTTDATPPAYVDNFTFQWAEVTNVSFPVTISSVGVTGGNVGNGGRFVAIEIDGKLLVDQSITPPGATEVTGDPLIASANDVEYLDGNTLGVNGVSGTWLAGLHAQGAQITATAPSPSSIQYTSANGTPLTTAFSGTDATLTTRTWTWQESNAVTGPWTTFATRTDTPGQDGATPLASKPTLAENKFYQVKVRYNSNNAEYVESTFNTFKTGTN